MQRVLIEKPEGGYHIFGVLRTRGFVGGVHGKLGQTYIHGVEGNLSVRNIAEGAAAGHIRAVGIILERHARLFADGEENRCGNELFNRISLQDIAQ